MLFGQHYGTTDATWPRMEPVYHYAWELANAPRYRGRPWSEVSAAVQREWTAAHGDTPWQHAEGPIHDVWVDVAAGAATGAEGGHYRRIARQGGDQSGPATSIATDR